MRKKQSYAADLLGLSRLTVDAVAGVTDLAQALHMTILQRAVPDAPRLAPIMQPLRGATQLAYRSVHGVTRLVGNGIDRLLTPLIPLLGEQSGWAGREALLAAINGVLGDHLAASHNPLAIHMTLRRNGETLALEAGALKQALPQVGGKILLLAHGLCVNDLQWQHHGHDHGELLQRERGYSALYLHYNSGRHISSNGRDLAHLLQRLVQTWPVPVQEIAILGHSMGGLVARSACHVAEVNGLGWRKKLRKLVFLGSPHQGAPLERGGNWINQLTDLHAYSAPFSRLAKIRSAGITDLRHASLHDEDWREQDRFAPDALPLPLPLPKNVQAYAIAATLGRQAGDLPDRMAGDGLVPLASALGQHAQRERALQFAPSNQAIVYQTNHMQLLASPQVRQLLLEWL